MEQLLRKADAALVDYVTQEYNVPPLRAIEIGRRVSFKEFSDALGQLEQTLGQSDQKFGQQTAHRMLLHGDVLDILTNGHFPEYLALARRAAQTLNGAIPENAETFYSMDALKSFLSPRADDFDVSAVVGKYKLFDPTNKNSRIYLDVLVRDGSLEIDHNARWNESCKGPRGGSILSVMAHQIRYAFTSAGLKKPDVQVNHGQGKLTIDVKDRKLLGAIQRKVYAQSRTLVGV